MILSPKGGNIVGRVLVSMLFAILEGDEKGQV
jgi:hypothetical protein